MEMKVKFLKDLFRMEKNALDLVDFHPVQRNFYYYLEKSEMDKESYEKFMKDLYQEDLIDIDLCGGSDFTYFTVYKLFFHILKFGERIRSLLLLL